MSEIVRRRPAFVVSSGRSGSRVLGRALGRLPSVAVLDEALCMLDPARLLATRCTGRELARLFERPIGLATLLTRHHLESPEFVYRLDDPDTRFDRSSGIPALSGTTLPGLCEDPDGLLDALLAWLRNEHGAVRRAAGDHVASVFSFLARSVGDDTWIERSGASLDYVGSILDSFPEARIVHLYRDGWEVANSMSSHPMFRLHLARLRIIQSTGVDPALDCSPGALDPREVPSEYRWALPGSFDPDAFRRWDPPVSDFTRLWAMQMRSGIRRLVKEPPERVYHIRYSDMVSQPAHTLAGIAEFLGFPDAVIERWAPYAALGIRHPPASPYERCQPDRASARLMKMIDRELYRAGVEHSG